MIRHQSSRWRWILKLDRRSKKINKTFLLCVGWCPQMKHCFALETFWVGLRLRLKILYQSCFCFKLFCGYSGRKNVPMQTLGGKMDALRHTSGCNFLLHRNSICVVRQRVNWHLVLWNQPTDNGAPSAVDVPEWWSDAIINHPTHNYSELSKLNLFHPKLV